MFCTTCGAVMPQGQQQCDFCGTRAASFGGPAARGAGAPAPAFPAVQGYPMVGHAHAPAAYGPGGEPFGLCPRCAFNGPGAGYFSSGGNIAKLVVLTVVAWPITILYYFLRKDHRVCPRCGLKWGPHGQYALAPGALRSGAGTPVPADAWMGDGERSWSTGAIALWAVAALMMMGGLLGLELGPFLAGAAMAGGGYALQRKRDRDREARREQLLGQLQQPVLQLAAQQGGRLTVTQVASAMSWPIPRAEKVLNSLDDGFRVVSDVTPDGVIVYEFRELARAPDRLAPPSA